MNAESTKNMANDRKRKMDAVLQNSATISSDALFDHFQTPSTLGLSSQFADKRSGIPLPTQHDVEKEQQQHEGLFDLLHPPALVRRDPECMELSSVFESVEQVNSLLLPQLDDSDYLSPTEEALSRRLLSKRLRFKPSPFPL